MKRKAIVTTGDIATHCHVSYDTVMSWIKGGRLKAYTTPGGHHRIRTEDFNSFLEEYNMPRFREQPEYRKKVLVVDDDPGLVEVIVEYLGHTTEYELTTAVDGFCAGIEVVKSTPDLIILDLMMPFVDGYEVCRKVKLTPETEHIKILVLTGYASEANSQKALNNGADYCMSKPVKMVDLKAKVDELLSDKKAQVSVNELEYSNDGSSEYALER